MAETNIKEVGIVEAHLPTVGAEARETTITEITLVIETAVTTTMTAITAEVVQEV